MVQESDKLQGIPELYDANNAGTAKSLDCTLILTEEVSNRLMAVSVMTPTDYDNYGIFPLEGKILNVREATRKQMLNDAKINNLIKILGLQYKKKYKTIDDMKTLRYGKIMLMADPDENGSHFKGLLINFIHHNWPSLLKMDFIEEFITPIVKATKGDQVLSFFSLLEFEECKKQTGNFYTYEITYYRGLSTFTREEAEEYFHNMTWNRIRFRYDGNEDDKNIIMAFSKECVDQRKEWMTNYMNEAKRRRKPGLSERFLYEEDPCTVSYSDFINFELVMFSHYNNIRSIPSMIDGFTHVQRKAMFTCFKRNDEDGVVVALLARCAVNPSTYLYNEVSLITTSIIGLAQDFVGSNNINLLMPNGQFGNRHCGLKDYASDWIIRTMLNPLARFIFHEYDYNQNIEPVYYIPIIPMVLVNGADGIGSDWMTKIPKYNVREIIENLYRMMEGADPKPMIPFYKNFKGTIESCGDNGYVISGEISVIGPDKVEITELPIGTWIQDYDETVLEPMLHGTDKSPPMITDYTNYSNPIEARFIVTMSPDKLVELERDGLLHKVFKLQTTLSTTSMRCFDENLCLKKYDNVLQILREFYKVRINAYQRRKAYLEGILEAEVSKLSNQVRFILEKSNGDLVIENKKKKDIIAELVRRNYDSDPVIAWKLFKNRGEVWFRPEEDNYDYLLGMTMRSLTEEFKDELLKQRDAKVDELQCLPMKTPMSLWKDDLDALLAELDKVEEEERQVQGIFKKNNEEPPPEMYNAEKVRRILPTIDGN